jgi:hypothetical protein
MKHKAAGSYRPRNLSFIPCLLIVGACGLQDPSGLVSADIIELTTRDSVLLADSISRTQVTARLLGEVPRDAEIKFTADAGRFAESSPSSPRETAVKASGGSASVTFVAPAASGQATITVTIGGYLARRTIILAPARPVEIILGSDRTVAKANGQDVINLRARLLRPEGAGVVSLGTRVRFFVQDSAGQDLPNLRGVGSVTSADGVVAQPLSYDQVGPLTVQAVVGEGADQVRSNQLRLRFVPP